MDRLERIKNETEFNHFNTPETGEFALAFNLKQDDFNWLIKQVEKVEELRKENWALHQEIGGYAGRIEALTEEFDMLTGRMKLLKTQMFNPK